MQALQNAMVTSGDLYYDNILREWGHGQDKAGVPWKSWETKVWCDELIHLRKLEREA